MFGAIKEILKAIGWIIVELLKGLIWFFDNVSQAAKEFNESYEKQQRERTFTDLRDAIDYLIKTNDKYAQLNNSIQVEWLIEHKVLDGHEVKCRYDDDGEVTLNFNHQQGRKIYNISVIELHYTPVRYMVMIHR